MSRITTKAYISTREQEIAQMIGYRRLFATELKKLRSLPAPNIMPHWWLDALLVQYEARLLDMKQSERWLTKFSLVVPLERITSEDNSSDGTRLFTGRLKKGGKELFLQLLVRPILEGEDPQANCRKVVIGQDTHTYTSPRYAIVCD